MPFVMKIIPIYKEILSEDFKSQKRRYLSQGIEPDIIDSYIEKFKHIKDKKYKEMFDPKLDIPIPPDKRNNIDAYTDFHDLEKLVDFVGGRRPVNTVISKSNETIDVSGEAIYKDANFELYYADNPRACIKYKGKFPYSWCVARSDSSNMFYTYRFKPYEPAFYFVKDIKAAEKEFGIWNMTKNVFQGKFHNPYHFFVIQVPKNINQEDTETKQYIVTSANNNGDIQMSWDDILKLNPNVSPLHKLLVPKPFTPEEREQHERFKKGISDEEFKRLSYEDKRNYLDIYPTIARPITDGQFIELPEDLLNLYVSFGIGLNDTQFNHIKPMSAIVKRYAQISKRKFDEYMKMDKWNRQRLKMTFTELIMLSDADIKLYLESLDGKEINMFVKEYGIDKFEFLEKHLPEKFTKENSSIKQLLINGTKGTREEVKAAISKLQEIVPENTEIHFFRNYIVISSKLFYKITDKLDSDMSGFYDRISYDTWSYDYGYYEGDTDRLEEEYTYQIEQIVKTNTDLGNRVKKAGLPWDVNTVKDLLDTHNKKEDIFYDIEESFSTALNKARKKAFEETKKDVDSIIHIISYDNEIEINVSAFYTYLAHHEFFSKDPNIFYGNMKTLLEEILKDHDVINNDEDLYQQVEDMSQNNMIVDINHIQNNITSDIEDSLDKFLEANEPYNDDDDDDDDTKTNTKDSNEVAKLKSQIIQFLGNTLKGLGQDPTANSLQNNMVKINIDRTRFQLNGQVYVKMLDKNKKRNPKEQWKEGYVYIKDIPSYFRNYKLFEELNRIKSLIRY